MEQQTGKEKDFPTYHPYSNRIEFEVADFLYHKNQMSAGDIDHLLTLWAATLAPHGDTAPFLNHREMYQKIDATLMGDVPWESFSVSYQGGPVDGPRPSWMDVEHVVWFRDPRMLVKNLIANPDFSGEFDFVPYHEYNQGQHIFGDFMSGNWAWRKAVESFCC